jgi:hypothetical protein
MCVVTSFVLEEIIGNRLAMARIAKWALELMGLDIAYVPPNNDQVLGPGRLCGQVDRDSAAPPPVTQEHWSMYFDGSFTLNGVGGGVVLIYPKGDQLLYVI